MRLLTILWSFSAYAQITGSFTGYVLDPSRKPIPNAEVVAMQPDRGFFRKAYTGADGFYSIADLPPAIYVVTAKAKNFEAESTGRLQLAVDSRLRADFLLPVAGLAQSVDVAATVSLLSTGAAGLGATLDRSTIESLPLNRRDFLQLALLSPGVLPAVQDSELSSRGSFAMHAGGGREEFNNFLIDGVDNNDHYENTFALQPPVDSIQEFKIAASAYSAEYGRNAGGQVNVITRGGANKPHGSLYEYLRNRSLDARNFFDRSDKPQLIRNQFGVTAGGPVATDRSFYFANFDGLRERRGLTRLAAVPTLAERGGDLSALALPILDPLTRQPFPGNQIPGSRVSSLARRILDLFPLPNTSAQANYLAQPILKEAVSQFHGRLDHRLSSAGQITARYSFSKQDVFEPYTEELTDVPGFGDNVVNSGHNAMVHHTHVFNPRTFHSLRLGFGRSFREVLPQNQAIDAGKLWGVNWLGVAPRDFGFPLVNIAGYSHAGDATQLPLSRHINSYQIVEDLSLQRGRHDFKVGVELRRQRLTGFLDYFTRGSLSFSGAISGSGISDLLLGFPSFGIQATSDNRQALRSTASNFYAQDEWKLSPVLTLNLGLRYEFQTPPVDPADRMSVFDPVTSRIVNVGTNGVPRSGIRRDPNNFAPRVGFAWAAAKNLVIRGGYGIYYDSGMLVVNSSNYFNPPYFNVRIFFPTATSLLTLNNPFPLTGGLTPPPSPNTLSPDLTTAYLQHWNLGVQRQFGLSTTFSAAYAASKGTHLIRSRDLNQAIPGPGDVAARRPNPAFGGIFFIESGSNSSFQSLQLAVNRRLSRGVSLMAGYTRSKSIDDTSAFLGTKPDKNFPQDSRNYRAERAVSSFDAPQRLVAAAVYHVPGRHWWSRNIDLRAIGTAQSGQPFTPILRFDNSNTGNTGGIFGSDRPNLLRNPALSVRTPEQWFDTSAFAIPARNRFGNAGRSIVRGPGLLNCDLAASRRFVIREGFSLTADAQSFNFLNHAQFDLPERFAGEPAFGKIFSAKAPRQIQFALRLAW